MLERVSRAAWPMPDSASAKAGSTMCQAALPKALKLPASSVSISRKPVTGAIVIGVGDAPGDREERQMK